MSRLQEYLELKQQVQDRFRWQEHGKQIESIYFDLTNKPLTCKTGCEFFNMIKHLDRLLLNQNQTIIEMGATLKVKESHLEVAFNYPSMGINSKLGKELTEAEITKIYNSSRDGNRKQFFEPLSTEDEVIAEVVVEEEPTTEKKNRVRRPKLS